MRSGKIFTALVRCSHERKKVKTEKVNIQLNHKDMVQPSKDRSTCLGVDSLQQYLFRGEVGIIFKVFNIRFTYAEINHGT